MTLKDLIEQRNKHVAEAKAIMAKADAENREMNEEEIAACDEALDAADALKPTIDRKRRLEETEGEQRTSSGRRAAPPTDNDGSIDPHDVGSVRPRFEDDPNRGFKSPTDFIHEVITATTTGRPHDRLKSLRVTDAAGSDEHGEYSNQYGAFLLPEGFSPQLLQLRPEGNPLAARTTKIPMAQPAVKIPARVDKNHTSSVSGGLTVARRLETTTASTSRMQFEQVALSANSLFGAAYATEELLLDSPISFAALIAAGFDDEFESHMLDEMLNGTGVGEYLGINNSPCLITQDAESGQGAGTITYTNVIKMRSRCWGYERAIWIANPDTIPQLSAIKNPAAGQDSGIFHASAQDDIPDRLLGRPIVFTDACETLSLIHI